MDESLKSSTTRFAEQQYQMFGEIVVTPRSNPSTQLSVATAPDSTAGASQFGDILSKIPEAWVNASSLESLEQMISTCQKCPLGLTRTKFVFGVGNPNADIVVIGEAPGADEDRTGEPFVGLAGQLLNKILGAINLRREDVYIANILKSRPPGNRTPERAEVEQCIPYLLKQLEIIKPRFILALGLTAANTLLNRRAKMSELRGEVHEYFGIKVIVTYHPAALLRNPQWKRQTWDDVQHLRRLLDESTAAAA